MFAAASHIRVDKEDIEPRKGAEIWREHPSEMEVDSYTSASLNSIEISMTYGEFKPSGLKLE